MLELSIFQSATGASSFDTLSLEQLRGAARRGNKSAANHSHLCAPQDADPWHVGAGVSLTAAALLAAIDKFRSPDMKQLIKQDLYNKVPQEFAWIKVCAIAPALALLPLDTPSVRVGYLDIKAPVVQAERLNVPGRSDPPLRRVGAQTSGDSGSDSVLDDNGDGYVWIDEREVDYAIRWEVPGKDASADQSPEAAPTGADEDVTKQDKDNKINQTENQHNKMKKWDELLEFQGRRGDNLVTCETIQPPADCPSGGSKQAFASG
ncbi:hypothetical protein AK812_SmicGene31935 [Symbiodinium microadriaticum]|uniref:Uncharacterized protein n=1 Tax=Symbiodinium microadriaticum TaxID=2951 RepID=A0A1Q9CVH9_SYMMI|nr:hypothetical protein AK812_SmicGene31935 [Symbiodinium microadriaticum]